MPDTTPTPAPEPSKKPKFTRGIANRQFLNEIADSRKVATAGRDTDHTAALAALRHEAVGWKMNMCSQGLSSSLTPIPWAFQL